MPVASITLHIISMCLGVTTCLRPRNSRAGIIQVATIAKPENTAPATKYGGKIVVCQPGITDVAKSKDTMVWTESTRGVANPASTKDKDSWRCQCLVLPVHPNAAIP